MHKNTINSVTGPKPVRVTDVNKALTALRKQVTACGQSATAGQLYAAAEQLQHMAFDLKYMAAHGGSWAEIHESRDAERIMANFIAGTYCRECGVPDGDRHLDLCPYYGGE